jgi:hypothetical protein
MESTYLGLYIQVILIDASIPLSEVKSETESPIKILESVYFQSNTP